MVLGSAPLPAWLGPDAPDGDVVISSRARFARNLSGHRFPCCAQASELLQVESKVTAAAISTGLGLIPQRPDAPDERGYLIASHLLSPDFRCYEPGRTLLLDPSRAVSVMVNEEDHLRIQSLTAGWTPKTAFALSKAVLSRLQKHLEFAMCPNLGALTASPSNLGSGQRVSAMFHLVALAHLKQLDPVLAALGDRRVVARGLFGEPSRAIGAFFQVSSTSASLAEFMGAGSYLIREERRARSSVSRRELGEHALAAADFAVRSQTLSLADALRVLAWVRWASAAGIDGFPDSYRTVDRWLAEIDLSLGDSGAGAGRRRAQIFREWLRR